MSTTLPAPTAQPWWRRGLQGALQAAGQCEVCRAWSGRAVCKSCRHRFAPPLARCGRCAAPLPEQAAQGTGMCGACLRTAPPQSLTVAGLSYAYPWDGLIQRFKRQGAVGLAAVLAQPLEQAVHRRVASDQDSSWPHVLLPVPLVRPRLAERGHNPAWELAKVLGRRLHLQAEPALIERLVDTPPQRTLPREQRLANVRGAFALAPGARDRLTGRRVALVDDVMTTGATAAEVATTLLRAGVADVQVWVAARTQLD